MVQVAVVDVAAAPSVVEVEVVGRKEIVGLDGVVGMKRIVGLEVVAGARMSAAVVQVVEDSEPNLTTLPDCFYI